MGFGKLPFLGSGDDQPFISVDIGNSSIKLMSISQSRNNRCLTGVGVMPTPDGVLSNNVINKPEKVAEVIAAIIESNDMKGGKATIALPGPAVFAKKITMPYCSLKELETNIKFEAGNYIPYSIDAVRLDYQVLATNGPSMDILLVAVKNEVVNGYLNAVELAGLEPAIADVDHYALENMFEINYPEELDKTLALVNIGSRYSSVSIIQDGVSLFSGEVSVGGRMFTDALCENLEMKPEQAKRAKHGDIDDGMDASLVNETIDRTNEHVASELQRQIGFFWNSTATDRSIEGIYVSGGGAQLPGLIDELSLKTGIPCVRIEPLRAIHYGDSFDEGYVDEIKDCLGVSVGLACRRFGDKIHAISS